jgi:hypothetical protein
LAHEIALFLGDCFLDFFILMLHPKLKFKIDRDKDFKCIKSLAQDRYKEGRILHWALNPHYPLQNLVRKRRKFSAEDWRVIRNYLDEFYETNQSKIRKAFRQLTKKWQKREKIFYSLNDKLFEYKRWPKGRYIAYLTIWGVYPRFLEDKTFMVPYEHRIRHYPEVVIAHEMLHFKFYDFFREFYPKYKNPEKNIFVWHVSEIFNSVIQNSPQWRKVFRAKSMSYPEHRAMVRKLSAWWVRQPNGTDANALIDKIIQTIKNKKKFQHF